MNQSGDNKKATVVSIEKIELDKSLFDAKPAVDDLPILPARMLVLFPGVTLPITLGRPNSFVTVDLAFKKHIPIGIVCQIDPNEENPMVPEGLYSYGVVADILQVLNLPDGNNTALVRARGKFKILGEGEHKTLPQANLSAKVKLLRDYKPKADDREYDVILSSIHETVENILKKADNAPKEMLISLNNSGSPEEMINLIGTHMPFEASFKQKLLSMNRPKQRAFALLSELKKNEQIMDMTHEIQSKARKSLDKQQRTMILQQQMEAIRQELYGDVDDATLLGKRAEEMALPEPAAKVFDKELEKLRRINPQSPDYSMQYSYLETLLDLPWHQDTPLNNDFAKAREILNEEHYGLDKVKERILEQLAVLMNAPNGKSPILCLVGAPGVGKTSLGQTIAKALGRRYQRVSLGGMHDEAEIRGHRRTYIGAMPGRIIDSMKRAKSTNPVILLDEIDKMGHDFKGDPSAALLEVLDPEQNCHFHDNYIDVDYDLSNVLFIATANTLTPVSQPLLDRMEIIEISGYLLEEKVEIAKRHLIPRIIKEQGFNQGELDFSNEALVKIIENYTSESGVRQLEKSVASVVRKIVLKKMKGEEYPVDIKAEHVKEFLGAEIFNKERYEGNDFAGVVTGLAWTSVGGEILFIESSLAKGKGDKLTLTGNLGDVMKESAVIALQYVKAHAVQLGIDSELFDKYSLHIHVPEGAIPKDGPSAGITMAASIVSAFTQRKVRPRMAMTGEITLRGKVLPVGGIKEKILAAKRAGITDIVLSKDNRKDVEEISEIYIQGLAFHYVSTVMEVIEIAISAETVPDAITL